MANNFMSLARKLQGAINSRPGAKVTINTSQWYSKDKQRTIICYTLRQSNEEDGYKDSTVLFKTYSQIQLVLFLRDYWYTLNGWELPTDNEIWEEVKRRNGENITAEKISGTEGQSTC